MEFWNKARARSPAIFSLAATLLFWGFYDRYEPVETPLLEAPTLAEARDVRGDATEDAGRFVFVAAENSASARFALSDATRHEWIRVRCRARAQGVVRGKHPWSQARVLLLQYYADDKWIGGSHVVFSEQGTVPWTFAEEVFELDARAKRVDLLVENRGSAGRSECAEIVVEPVRVRGSYGVWRVVFLALWLSLGALYFKRCRLDHRRLRALILLNALMILAGALAPSEWIANPSLGLKKAFEKTVPAKEVETAPKREGEAKREAEAKNRERMDRFTDVVGGAHRAGHFALFASLCFLVYCSAALEGRGRVYFAKVVFDLALFAAITEALQFLTWDRTPGVRDFLIDLQGVVFAFVVFAALFGVVRFARRAKSV